MSFEIERKFLVCDNDWQRLATSHTSIRHAYLSRNGKALIRVRIKCGGAATLTIKSRPVDIRRLELEYVIPALEAEALMQLRQDLNKPQPRPQRPLLAKRIAKSLVMLAYVTARILLDGELSRW
jgi:CYTH domain-containing protein